MINPVTAYKFLFRIEKFIPNLILNSDTYQWFYALKNESWLFKCVWHRKNEYNMKGKGE